MDSQPLGIHFAWVGKDPQKLIGQKDKVIWLTIAGGQNSHS